METENKLMGISEFAKLSGLTRKKLLFYDDKDVLKPIKKNEKGYRFYSESQIYEVTFIKILRSLNYSYEKIRKVRNTEKRNLVEEIEKQIDAITRQQELLSTVVKKLNGQLAFLRDLPLEKDCLAIRTRKDLNILCDKEEFQTTKISIQEIFQIVMEKYDLLPHFPDGIFIRKNNEGSWVFSFFRKIESSNVNSVEYATLHTENLKLQEALNTNSLDELVHYFSNELNVTLREEIYIEVYFIEESPFVHDNYIFTLSVPIK